MDLVLSSLIRWLLPQLGGTIIGFVLFLTKIYCMALDHWEYNTWVTSTNYWFMVLLCQIWKLVSFQAPFIVNAFKKKQNKQKNVFSILLLVFHWRRKVIWVSNDIVSKLPFIFVLLQNDCKHFRSFCLLLNSVWVFIFLDRDPSDADEKLTMLVTH